MRIGWKTRGFLLGILGLVAIVAGNVDGTALSVRAPERPPPVAPLIVHEWGTFLSVQGSDGVSLGGMVDSEEALPDFVRERALAGRNRRCLNQKMETPVTYFYTDRPQVVRMRVDMPRGLLTHWSPAVQAFGPPLKLDPKGPPPESYLDWGPIELIPDQPPPARSKAVALPQPRPVDGENTWRFVRQTDSALVRVQNARQGSRPFPEAEKFLFYRGVGEFELPLEIRSFLSPRCGTEFLRLINRGKEPLAGLFLIRVEKRMIRVIALADLRGGASHELVNLTGPARQKTSFEVPLKEGVPRAKKAVAEALVKQGLYPKEAEAMVNNWEKSYFRTEGTRALYMIPRAQVDTVIPLHLSPAPTQLVRVMVGRVEMLLPDQERRLEETVAKLADKDPKVRQAAQAELAKLGRLREPVLRRILALTKNPEVRTQVETLLKAAS